MCRLTFVVIAKGIMGKTDIIYFYSIQFTSYKRHFEDTQPSQSTVLQKLSLCHIFWNFYGYYQNCTVIFFMISIRIFWEDELSLKSLPNAKSCYQRNNYKCLNFQRIRQVLLIKTLKMLQKQIKRIILKRRGPKIEPSGIPVVISRQLPTIILNFTSLKSVC